MHVACKRIGDKHGITNDRSSFIFQRIIPFVFKHEFCNNFELRYINRLAAVHKPRLAIPLDMTALLLEGSESRQRHTHQPATGRFGVIYFATEDSLPMTDVKTISPVVG